MRSNAEAQRRLRQRRLARIRAYKHSQGCGVCGEDDAVVLDLHHRDPVEKHSKLRYRGRSYSTGLLGLSDDALTVELTKCDVLCANCHRRETYRQHAEGAFTNQGEAPEPMPTLFNLTG